MNDLDSGSGSEFHIRPERPLVGETFVELSIVMPCLDEAATLARCIGKARGFLARSGIRGEVIVADNGSTDSSREIASAAGARLVAVSDRGYGAALMGGILAARGRYVIIGDSDDSYDLARLDGFVAKLRQGCGLVVGNRFRGGIAPGAMPLLHRHLGNPVLSWAGRLLFGCPIGDFHCGLRGFDRAAILALDLRTQGMEFASEMVVKATLAGLRIAEVPTTLAIDGRDRASHLRTWRDGWRHLRFLLMYSPRWLFLYPGVGLLLLGAAGMALVLPRPLHVGAVVFDVHTLLIAMCAIVAGTQICFLYLLANQFAVNERLLPASGRFSTWRRHASLERFVLGGALLMLLGAAGLVWAFLGWRQVAFSDLDYRHTMRVMIPSVTAVAVGLQAVTAGFVSSILDLKTIRR